MPPVSICGCQPRADKIQFPVGLRISFKMDLMSEALKKDISERGQGDGKDMGKDESGKG